MKTVRDLLLELTEEFSADVLDEGVCRDWFLKKLHPGGVFCPGCGQEVTSPRKISTFWGMGRIHCHQGSCVKSFSALTGTALNGIGIPFRALYLLLFLVACGVPVNKVARQLGISNGAAYIWANKAKDAGLTCES